MLCWNALPTLALPNLKKERVMVAFFPAFLPACRHRIYCVSLAESTSFCLILIPFFFSLSWHIWPPSSFSFSSLSATSGFQQLGVFCSASSAGEQMNEWAASVHFNALSVEFFLSFILSTALSFFFISFIFFFLFSFVCYDFCC